MTDPIIIFIGRDDTTCDSSGNCTGGPRMPPKQPMPHLHLDPNSIHSMLHSAGLMFNHMLVSASHAAAMLIHVQIPGIHF